MTYIIYIYSIKTNLILGKGKLVESNSKTRPKSKESVGKKQQNDSLLKLIPLQPYLVQKIDENNSNVEVRSSKSTVYNPGVDKVDSRIVYKKHQSGSSLKCIPTKDFIIFFL